MIRVIIYLVILAALAFGAVWMADRPGEVAITWQGRRIDTSVMVLLAAVAALVVASVIAWSILRAILRAPEMIARYRRYRRGVRGYRAVSQGLIAVGSGDARAAHLVAQRAERAAQRRPRRRRRHLPADGGARRYSRARPARALRRGAAA